MQEEEEYTDLPLNLINPQISSSRSLPHTTNRTVFSDNVNRTILEETSGEPSGGERGKLRLQAKVRQRQARAVRRARCTAWSVEVELGEVWPAPPVSTLSVRSPAVTECW